MSGEADDLAAIAHRFLDAITTGDVDTVRALYAEDAAIWHNHDCLTITRDDNIETLRRFAALAPVRRYFDRRLDLFPGGFVEQHILVAERADGRRLELPACLVCRVEHGRITQLNEYFDPAPVTAWLAPAD